MILKESSDSLRVTDRFMRRRKSLHVEETVPARFALPTGQGSATVFLNWLARRSHLIYKPGNISEG